MSFASIRAIAMRWRGCSRFRSCPRAGGAGRSTWFNGVEAERHDSRPRRRRHPAVLAALDAGRSLWARVGFAQPRSRWSPDPAEFAPIAWPPGADAKPELPAGQRIFLQRCQACHGPGGRGNGPAAPSMSPRPRDFTLGQFKYVSTPPGAPAADADLIRTVRAGLQASAMPYFGDLLSDEELRAVVADVRSLGPRAAPAAPLPVSPRVPAADGGL